MVELSENARKGLNDYLQQVRNYLRWSKSLDCVEVEQNIAEHIERELEGTPEPVSAGVLEGVLARLGSPSQWVPPEALGWWGRLIIKLRTDSQDWRLAYVSFALLLTGLLFFLATPLIFVFIGASFITSRAALAAAGGPKDLGAQRWLLYPPLLIVGAFFLGTLLAGPGVLAGIVAAELHAFSSIRRSSDMGMVAFIVSAAMLISSAWWMILGVLACKWPEFIRAPLHPFAAGFNRRRALSVSAAGVLLLLLLAAFVFLYMNDAFAIFT